MVEFKNRMVLTNFYDFDIIITIESVWICEKFSH